MYLEISYYAVLKIYDKLVINLSQELKAIFQLKMEN